MGNTTGATTINGSSITLTATNINEVGSVGVTGPITQGSGSNTFGGASTFNGAVTINNTVTSSGNSTLGTGGGATSNSFGTAGGAAAVSNVIGNQVSGSTNQVNGVTTTDNASASNGSEALIIKGGAGALTATGQLEGNGQGPGTPQVRWADSYSLTAGNQAATSFTIYNSLISATSTIIISPVSNGGTIGIMTISGQAAGSFTVSTTSADFTGIGTMNYSIINH
jgi:hypothetical protein